MDSSTPNYQQIRLSTRSNYHAIMATLDADHSIIGYLIAADFQLNVYKSPVLILILFLTRHRSRMEAYFCSCYHVHSMPKRFVIASNNIENKAASVVCFFSPLYLCQ